MFVAQVILVRGMVGVHLVIAASIAAAACTAGAATELHETLPPGNYEPAPPNEIELPPDRAALRDEALRRAKVWRDPGPISAVRFDRTDPNPWASSDTETCRFLPGDIHGTTGKFDCVLPDRQVIKVKYDPSGEIPSELAASRLLHALGFGSDRMHLLRRVRCFGCPRYPFLTFKLLEWISLRDRYVRHIDYADYTDFDWVSVERRFPAPELKVDGREKGWSWFELRTIDAAAGGARRDELDALRLVAILLNHWDNKSENQRLVCLGGWSDRSGCVDPFAFVQDVGSTFGPKKANFSTWSATRIWTDEARCVVSMKSMPFEGSTFEDTTISEGGRRWLAARLTAITDAQLRALFAGARFAEQDGARDREAQAARWATAFRDKVRQIADRPACRPV